MCAFFYFLVEMHLPKCYLQRVNSISLFLHCSKFLLFRTYLHINLENGYSLFWPHVPLSYSTLTLDLYSIYFKWMLAWRCHVCIIAFYIYELFIVLNQLYWKNNCFKINFIQSALKLVFLAVLNKALIETKCVKTSFLTWFNQFQTSCKNNIIYYY